MNVDTAFGEGAARNFMKVLELIDRTILPRRLSLSNGTAWLVLTAARQQAWLEPPGGQSAGDAAKAIASLCATDDTVRWGIEAIERTPPATRGHSAAAIVNAQGQAGSPSAGPRADYRFRRDGWPLAAPAGASFASLAAASRIAAAMSRWRLPDSETGEGTLIFALADGLPSAVSVAIDGGPAVASTPPAQLGQMVSRWRGRS